jgi:hypothetical protein
LEDQNPTVDAKKHRLSGFSLAIAYVGSVHWIGIANGNLQPIFEPQRGSAVARQC